MHECPHASSLHFEPQSDDCVDAQSIIVLRVGAVEQHGPHLPFHTDHTIAERFAAEAVERVVPGVDAWLLLPLAFTKSNDFGRDGHIGHPLGASSGRRQALSCRAVESFAAALHEIDAFELPMR